MAPPKRRYDMTGRAEKAQRTRERICESAIRLYMSRPLEEFTLERVAEDAETTVQTVLRAYGSKEDLILAALGTMAPAGTPLKVTPPGDVAAAVRALFDLYETVGDMLIDRLGEERRRPTLRPSLDEGRANHRAWVAKVFSPQLQTRVGRDQQQTFEALSVATDLYVWKLLRRDAHMTRKNAEAVVVRMIAGVTGKENSHAPNAVAELVRRR